MRVGALDRMISIERAGAAVPDEAGTPRPTWTTVATVWAEKRQQSGAEFFAHGSATSETKVVFRVRWRPDLLRTDRIYDRGRRYEIVEIRELGRRDGLELHTISRDAF